MGTELQLGLRGGLWVGLSREMLWGWVGSEGTDGGDQGDMAGRGWKRQSDPLGRVGGWDLLGDRRYLAGRHGVWERWKGRVGGH